MEENSKSNVTFNIYGGNNQILPNATEAVQNFYGDQFADQKLHSEGESTDAPMKMSNVSLYILIRWNLSEVTSLSSPLARQQRKWAR